MFEVKYKWRHPPYVTRVFWSIFVDNEKITDKNYNPISDEVKSLLILNLCNSDDMDHDDLEVHEEFSETEGETDETDEDL